MYASLSILFATLIAAGTLLTLALFKFNLNALKQTGLHKKIMMWVPFAVIFLLILRLGFIARFIVFALTLLASLWEFFSVFNRQQNKKYLVFFLSFFLIGFVHLGTIRFITRQPTDILLYLVIGTVVSDVCGFFFGNLFGRHKLPVTLNRNKSWEGVFGQICGALLGVLLVKLLVLHQGNIWIFLPIGIGCALGDLLNSRAKRLAEIKNWSNLIPGHGGFLDRFCSLAGSSLLTFYYLLLL